MHNKTSILLGAIAGDVIGSVYEFAPIKQTEFTLFSQNSRLTDDSILTLAVADAILHNADYSKTIHAYARAYPGRGYGGNFSRWIAADVPKPYNSFGNGSAMRVSAVGWAFDDEKTVLAEARKSAECTHNHPEGIKGAQAVALAIWMARNGESRETICAEIVSRFGYDLSRTLPEVRATSTFNETCQVSVPEALIAFRESTSFEDGIRKAVSLGGDADTQAAICGSIAEAYYGGTPELIQEEILPRIPSELMQVIDEFSMRFSR